MKAFRLATLLLFATIISAAAEAILPTAEGTTWEYEAREQPPNPNGSTRVTVRVSGVEQLGSKDLLKLETRVDDSLVRTELISVDDTGVHCARRTLGEGKAVSFDPPQTLVPAPLKEGATWELDDRAAGSDMHQQFTVAAQETVTVRAGTYHAFRLHCEQPWPVATTIDRWFAPGVGCVKDVTATRGPNGRLLNRVTTELKGLSRTAAPSPTVAPTPAPEPIATPGRPRVSVGVAAEREGEPQTEFRSDVPNIFVRWSGQDLPVDTKIRVAWVAEDVGDLAPHDFVVDETHATVRQPDYSARFTLSRPQDGWAEGKYRVDVYVNDDRVASVSVTIHD
jgi:hypothetical protein